MNILWSIAQAAETAPAAADAGLDFTSLFIKMLVFLVVIVALGFVLMRAMGTKGRFGKKSGDQFEVVSWYRLEPKKMVYLLRVGKRIFAVGAAESSIHTIAELKPEDLVEEQV